MTSLGHIALYVPDLRAAENFYQDLFEMQLLMREAKLADGQWYTLPPEKEWEDAWQAGFALDMITLQRGAFVLALFQGRPSPQTTVLEIGVHMAAEEIAAVRQRLPETTERVHHEYGDLLFDDPYGYRWHLRPTGERFQSNGESSGRWLKV